MKLTIRPTRPAIKPPPFSHLWAALGAASALLVQPCSACTGLSIETKDGSIVTGRTLEFGADPQSQIVAFPAGTKFVGTVPNGTGLPFKSQYGFAGANGFGVQNAIIDGLNEKGLYVGLFYSPGCAKIMEPTPENNAIRGLSLAPFGMGGGLVGLPGDFTPPSRFVRIATYLHGRSAEVVFDSRPGAFSVSFHQRLATARGRGPGLSFLGHFGPYDRR